MAFTTGKLIAPNSELLENSPEINVINQNQNSELNPEELGFLLNLLKNADLKGHQVEMFYNMAIKLQDQFVKKSK
jgi:hypothetical protein